MQRDPVAHLAADARDRLRLFHRHAAVGAVAIAASTIPIAIVANGLRVAGTGVLAHYYGRRRPTASSTRSRGGSCSSWRS